MSKEIFSGVWISWEVQTRNRSMASAIGIPLKELISDKPRLFRYMILLWRTTILLWNYRGKRVFVQNPSIVLAFWAVCLKSIFRIKVIVDFHNSGLFPLEGRSSVLLAISCFICRKADLSIVTNKSLSEVVQQRGGVPIVITDPLNNDEFYGKVDPQESGRNYLLFVCSWAEDEPWDEVLKAVEVHENSTKILVTGNYRKCLSEKDISKFTDSIQLLGFVDREEYVRVLQGARAMVDLTTRDHCLVCGAYEAVAAEVPLLLTDSEVNREVFHKGAVYTANDAASISEAIKRVNENYQALKDEVRSFKSDYSAESERQIQELKAKLQPVKDEVA